MRKSTSLLTILLVVLAVVSCLTVSTRAQAQPSPPPKFGFVNSYEVLYGTEEGKQALDKLNQLMQEKQQLFEKQRSEIEKLRDQLASQARNLNVETQAEMSRDVEERQKNLTRFQEDAQTEINRRRDEALGVISEKVQKIINDYAQQNGFGAIFLRDPQFVTYVAVTLDITPEIIKIYNQKHPAAAPAAQPAAKPPAS